MHPVEPSNLSQRPGVEKPPLPSQAPEQPYLPPSWILISLHWREFATCAPFADRFPPLLFFQNSAEFFPIQNSLCGSDSGLPKPAPRPTQWICAGVTRPVCCLFFVKHSVPDIARPPASLD